MVFKLTTFHLQRLCKLNHITTPNSGLIFFGLRGCLPVNTSNLGFQAEHQLDLVEVNYTHPRCTLGQWQPANEVFAVFTGSTVPHRKHVQQALASNGMSANQLMSGYFDDYRKGIHRPGEATAHEAFRQTRGRPIRRSANNLIFDNDDRVEFDNPFDNLHAAWSMGVNHDDFASAGCQVVVGYPKCARRSDRADEGPWKAFKENAYASAQDRFPYLLLEGRDAQQVALSEGQPMSARLRYGSQGDLVKQMQQALQEKLFYEGNLDGEFGERTLRAVLKYQTATFGPSADDGIVGPITASTLGLSWPAA